MYYVESYNPYAKNVVVNTYKTRKTAITVVFGMLVHNNQGEEKYTDIKLFGDSDLMRAYQNAYKTA